MSNQPLNDAIVAPKSELLRGTIVAAVVAAIVLTVAVLPAEYGIDPTGAGRALGLTKLHAPTAPATAPAPANAAAAANAPTAIAATGGSTVSAPGEQRALTISSKPVNAYRADEMEITLPAGKGLEVKTKLAKGATLIYTWKTKNAEKVDHDFHGEPVNAKENEFESFILEDGVSESKGTVIAPFTGVHGWYWKNKSAAPVTLVLKASGFYSDIYRK
ncbi:MAG: transmembrane anchor protein [Pseudomonadota bacterium]